MTISSELAEAWSLLAEGRSADALAMLKAVPFANTGVPSLALAMKGAICVQAGDLQGGLAALDFDWSIASADAAGVAGAALFGAGRFHEALPALHRAVNEENNDPVAHAINLGRTLLYLGQASEALPYLQRGVSITTDHLLLAQQSLAEALVELGRPDDALAILPDDMQDEALIIARSSVMAMAGRYSDAESYINEAMLLLPESVPLMLLQADLSQVRGRDGTAISMLRRALEKEPENIALWARLAQTGRGGASGTWAQEAAEKAMALAAEKGPELRALATTARASVLSEEGNVSGSEQAYREALLLVPGHLPALLGLGHLLMQNGRVTEAIDCFKQVRAVAPLQGWIHLIHAREVPEDPAVLEEMERAAYLPCLEGPVRSSLLYTLAAAWDRKKDFDRAMKLASAANGASKKLISYNPAAHRARIEREISRFSRQFMSTREGWGITSRLPVFVLGMPRSGTTLTEQILGSHSKIFGAGELGLVGEQIARLETWERHIGSGLQYPECIVDLDCERSRRIAGKWLRKLQDFDLAALHVVDKLPHNFQHIGLIKLFFPNAIIFHCRRDPRDVAVSNYITDYAAKFSGMGFAYDLDWIGEQLVDHDRLMQHWHAVFPGQIFEVVYEELVENTETWARQMIDFMGLQWEPSVLEFQSLKRSVKTASAWQVRQPIYTTSKARWKRYESHLGPLEKALEKIPQLPHPAPIPDVSPGQFTLGMTHLKANRPVEAAACFSRVISLYPDHAAAHHFLGAALLQQGKAKAAVRSMKQGLRHLPAHATWWENLAMAERIAGNEEGAKSSLARAQKLAQRRSGDRMLQSSLASCELVTS